MYSIRNRVQNDSEKNALPSRRRSTTKPKEPAFTSFQFQDQESQSVMLRSTNRDATRSKGPRY